MNFIYKVKHNLLYDEQRSNNLAIQSSQFKRSEIINDKYGIGSMKSKSLRSKSSQFKQKPFLFESMITPNTRNLRYSNSIFIST